MYVWCLCVCLYACLCVYVFVGLCLYVRCLCLCCRAKSVDLQVVPDGNSTESAGKRTDFERTLTRRNSNTSTPHSHPWHSLMVSNRINMKHASLRSCNMKTFPSIKILRENDMLLCTIGHDTSTVSPHEYK